MNFAELLLSRLTEVEKIKLRMSASEDALIGRYWDFHHELSGSKFRGGTVEDGIEEMRFVRDSLMERYAQIRMF